MTCELPEQVVERLLDKIATQYRESPIMLGLYRRLFLKSASVNEIICQMLDYFDIDTAIGDQLTIVGKWLGWPRCHCVGRHKPVFGFSCDTCGELDQLPLGGFCEDVTWVGCSGPEYEDFCFEDDEIYRRFLKARSWQLRNNFEYQTLDVAIKNLFGTDGARVIKWGNGTVLIHTGRKLSFEEKTILHLFRDVLPVAPGVSVKFIESDAEKKPFGFGQGWGGFCDDNVFFIGGSVPDEKAKLALSYGELPLEIPGYVGI